MTLADDAATGSADREAVAIALGCTRSESGWWFCRGFRNPRRNPPDYQTDLAATLAEIERRGWDWTANYFMNFERHAKYYIFKIWDASCARLASTSGTTIANAACAALLKALENSDD